MKELIQKIRNKINTPLEDNGYKLADVHVEIGNTLHCETYYFAKKYFQNIENCDDLSLIFLEKAAALELPENTTLIGIGNFMGLFFKKIVLKKSNFNYCIIEEIDQHYFWRTAPILKSNIFIVLPISVTSSIYFRLRKFVLNHLQDLKLNDSHTVMDEFLNVFMVRDSSLKNYDNYPVIIDSNSKLSQIYSPFNWFRIFEDRIEINKNSPFYTGHSLINLFSKLHSNESCNICYPDDENMYSERLLMPTQDNYQTPSLIFGFPNFGKSKSPQSQFQSLLKSCDNENRSHLHGNIFVNEVNYDNYIRGDNYYNNNRVDILSFFDLILKEKLSESDENIIFITSDSLNKSTFLDDIVFYPSLQNKSVSIFRFQPVNEFADNFISLYSDFIKQKHTKIIYFQEVLSSGKKFKLISDYLKHTNDVGEIIGLHGFDFLFTLVNRLSAFSHNELLRKLYSKKNPKPVNNIISFFHLNSPTLNTSRLDNYLRNNSEKLNEILDTTYLDTLKLRIGAKIIKTKAISLEINNNKNEQNQSGPYSLFFSNNLKYNLRIFLAYHPHFTAAKLKLLNLFLIHNVNNELSKDKYKTLNFDKVYKDKNEQLLLEIFDNVYSLIEQNTYWFFTSTENLELYFKYRNEEEERKLIKNLIVKILSRSPFIYYKNIFATVFKYSLKETIQLNGDLADGWINTFKHFRELKYYIKRSMTLNSSFIVSHNFLKNLKKQLTPGSIEVIMLRYDKKFEELSTFCEADNIPDLYYDTLNKAYKLQRREINDYNYFLLICYKEFLFKNPSKSLHLEEMLNSKDLTLDINGLTIKNIIQHPYYHFVTMLKVENSFYLNELKTFHKKHINTIEYSKRRNFSKYYFRDHNKNNPTIIAAQKFLKKSFYFDKPDKSQFDNIRRSTTAMLNAIRTLEDIKSKKKTASRDDKIKLNQEIRNVLDSVVAILQPGFKAKLQYAFCIEYRSQNSEENPTDNLYTIISEEDTDNPKVISLNTDGLITKILYGLHNNKDLTSEQTFITVVRENEEFVSIQDDFYYPSKPNELGVQGSFLSTTVDNLYRNDFLDSFTGKGLVGLDKSNMTHFFRLSTVGQRNEGFYSLEGQAVLVVMNLEPATVTNFDKFMNAEKVRLLLLIKEELLEYLKRQFDNDAFIELLENRKREIYRKKLEHGLTRYQTMQKKLFEDSINSKDLNLIIKNKRLYNIIDKITHAQLHFKNLLIMNENKVEFPVDEILSRFDDIFSSSCFCGCSIKKSEIRYGGFQISNINIFPSVFDIIFPELIVNMKNYSSRQIKGGLKITFNEAENKITFENDIMKPYLNKSFEKEYGGIYMIREIVKRLNMKPVNYFKYDGIFSFTLDLNTKN